MAGYNPNNYIKGKATPISDPIIAFDPSIIKKKSKADEATIRSMNDDSKRNIASMSGFAKRTTTVGNYSAVSSGQKSDRKFSLNNAIQTRRVRNLTEATDLLGVKPPTIRRYLRELGYSLDGLNNIVK